MPTPVNKVAGIGPATATLLENHGIHSAEDLAAQRVGDLAAIRGFNTIRAGQVIDAAKQLTAVAMSESSVLTVKPDKKDKDKKDKTKKKHEDQTKKSKKDANKKSSKEKKKSSPKKDKDKNKVKDAKKKSAKKK